MDDPSRRAPPNPQALTDVSAYDPYRPVPQAHPHAPQVHVQVPGVSVQIQNIVAPHPAALHPVAYPPPGYPPPSYAQAYPQPGSLQARAAAPERSVVGMMRDDASHRAMEAVARRGPARVLAYAVGFGAAALALFLLAMIAFGATASAVLFACVPLTAVSVTAFAIGARAGRGVATHHLEQAILRIAAKNSGTVRVVALAQATGRPLRECQVAIDAMVSSGHATVEADDAGALVYHVPDLAPRHALPAHEASESDASSGGG